MSRLDAGLYGIRDIASRDEKGLLGFLSCHRSLIWGYYKRVPLLSKCIPTGGKICHFIMTLWAKVAPLHRCLALTKTPLPL